ncbi:MAG: SAM-dependent DNA methyltransferase, partial [Muribaculaceae bacterium]|nr:SAM-dependent DNA methyltransferase [Muribaculaceae bacterium]
YFAYCVHNSYRFIKPGGIISAITSNAWLGKEYGIQFKKFLLSNFHIKYVVRSTAEHWFTDSQVSTIFFVLEKCDVKKPTKFISLNFKISDYFDATNVHDRLQKIENFYSEIDTCELSANTKWGSDNITHNVFHKKDGSIDVSIVAYENLVESLSPETNWSQFFHGLNPLEIFKPYLIQYCPGILKVIRGKRTGWNEMFVIKNKNVETSGISDEFLVPYVKSPDEFSTILFSGEYNYRVFTCSAPYSSLDEGTKAWIDRFEHMPNKNGSKTVSEANADHRPYGYSISPKSAHIVTALNPYERFFFSYSLTPFVIDQRMIAMQVQDGVDVELIAALLNSVTTFLTIEFTGISRHLGSLDLNADFLKKMRFLNPKLLSEADKNKIKAAFEPLKLRAIHSIFEECKMKDRIKFDRMVLKAFGINESILESLYKLLCARVRERITMKNK